MPYDGAGTEREQAHRGKSLASNWLLLWTFSQQQSAAPVLDWKNQAIEILNEPGWAVADHGPLHGDIRTLKIRRDCSLTLFIDTEAARGRHFPRRAIPPGGARIQSGQRDARERVGC